MVRFRKRKSNGISTKYLTEDEKAEYASIQYGKGREKALKKLRDERYSQTRTGALGRLAGSFANQRRRQIAYAQGIKSGVARRRTGKVGRPAGSYDPRYRAYGGVYGYRKILSAKLRALRLQQMRDAAISPQQQVVLNNFAAQQAQQRLSPEAQPIPDTTGIIATKSIHQEIDDYANLVP